MQEKINVEKSRWKLKKSIENKKVLWYPNIEKYVQNFLEKHIDFLAVRKEKTTGLQLKYAHWKLNRVNLRNTVKNE